MKLSSLREKKRKIQRKPGEQSVLPVRSSPEIQRREKRDAECNLTWNPFVIVEEYFDRKLFKLLGSRAKG